MLVVFEFLWHNTTDFYIKQPGRVQSSINGLQTFHPLHTSTALFKWRPFNPRAQLWILLCNTFNFTRARTSKSPIL